MTPGSAGRPRHSFVKPYLACETLPGKAQTLVWTSDCRQELRGPRQARRSPARSTGCSKSHHDAEGRTSDNTALFKQWDPGLQRPVLWSLQAPPNPVLGPQRGLEARSPHHPGPRPPGPSAPQGPWEQPPPSAMPMCDATSHPTRSAAPVSSHPRASHQEQRRRSGPRGSQPSLSAPCPPLPSPGRSQPPARPRTPSPGPGGLGARSGHSHPRRTLRGVPRWAGTSLLCQDGV